MLLLFALLAGLSLMHGVNASSMHGMPMPASAQMPMQVNGRSMAVLAATDTD